MRKLEAIGIIGGCFLVLALLSAFAFWPRDDAPTGDIGTAMQITRELHCEEDEDIVISLGGNGLSYGWCKQVIDR